MVLFLCLDPFEVSKAYFSYFLLLLGVLVWIWLAARTKPPAAHNQTAKEEAKEAEKDGSTSYQE